MDYTSYQLISSNTSSLNSGSYLSATESTLFNNITPSDIWFGTSINDVVEVGAWDVDQTLLGWDVLYESKSVQQFGLSYNNELNLPVTYSYYELIPSFTIYQDSDILLPHAQTIQSLTNTPSGSYVMTYNFTRNMAGNRNVPLVIKEISPSRTEIKLSPIGNADLYYNAYCLGKFVLNDVVPTLIQDINTCQYGEIYNQVKSEYQNEIATIQELYRLTTDGAVQDFLQNIYEDILIYATTPSSINSNTTNLIRIQGIRTFFTNYLLSNANNIGRFDNINSAFNSIVLNSVTNKFAPVSGSSEQKYIDAQTFVYNFFTEYFYQPISDALATSYNNQYYSPLVNALNFGNNELYPILNNGYIDERTADTDPLTLIIKLQDALPNNISEQSSCWISNIGLLPFVIYSILNNVAAVPLYTIGRPNFNAPLPNSKTSNSKLSYTSDDLTYDAQTQRNITIEKNLIDLNVDYTNFSNFIVFSSAEMRLKIFKNKIINLTNLSQSVVNLNSSSLQYSIRKNNLYPYYNNEITQYQSQMDGIVNSFDGYESYLYKSGNYQYQNGAFLSSSYVAQMDTSASLYDKYNRDSLIHNTPQYILSDSNNDDYIIFLSMVGHFFDNIYIYIANLPAEKIAGGDATQEFTRNIVDYMLETFGWNVDDTLEQTNILYNYLDDALQANTNVMSSEDRLKTVRNRILANLPQIYKTKGTEESIRLLLSCYGIPSVLLSVREYGGVNYYNNKAAYTVYERAYMYQWNTSSKYDTFTLPAPSYASTYLFKIMVDDSSPYAYGQEQILFGRVTGSAITSSITASGDWAVGFVRYPEQESAQAFFRIGYKNNELLKIKTEPFSLFDGNIYSVMLRKTILSGSFQYTSNVDAIPSRYDLYVKRNDVGNEMVFATASVICYEYLPNNLFDVSNNSNIRIGGWFADFNGQGFTGAMDKWQMWYDPISDSGFEEYVNNINSYSDSNGVSPSDQYLLFRMHTDYPFDVRGNGGKWENANAYYAVSSSYKQNIVFGTTNAPSVDYMVNTNGWSGNYINTVNAQSCSITQSTYPYQFYVVDYPSTLATSLYGPNKFRNEKIQYVSQSISARLDSTNRSTYVAPNSFADDSSQIGLFADPQDFKNKDIIRYIGNTDLMDVIGDPSNMYSSSYCQLNNLLYEYTDVKNQYSGSRTLFNEIITLYKCYFNKSIFKSIENLMPARATVLTGVVIEPTILERPKYASKPLSAEVNSGSVFNSEVTLTKYADSKCNKIEKLSEDIVYAEFNIVTSSLSGFNSASLPVNPSIDLKLDFVGYPNRDYPVNYGGDVISDSPDNYQMGDMIGGYEPIQYSYASINFSPSKYAGYVPLTVDFINSSIHATTFSWSFGDGSTNNSFSPTHSFTKTGVYPVTLIGSNPQYSGAVTKLIYVLNPITASFTISGLANGYAPLTVNFVNRSVNANSYLWNFGDGGTSTDVNPSYTYQNTGNYNVTLTASSASLSAITTSYSAVVVANPDIACTFANGAWISGIGTNNQPFADYLVSLGADMGNVTFQMIFGAIGNDRPTDHKSIPGAGRMELIYQNNVIYDSGNIISGTSHIFNKTSTYPYIVVRVYCQSAWSFFMTCP